MKRILLLAILFISLNAFGQGNLQFNQVLNIKNGDNYTVPAGKVLKITAFSIGNNNIIKIPLLRCDYSYSPYQQYTCIYDLNKVVMSMGGMNYNLAYNSNQYPYGTLSNGVFNQCSQCASSFDYTGGVSIGVQTPFWLKAGENITIAQGSGVLISAIEFNIIP